MKKILYYKNFFAGVVVVIIIILISKDMLEKHSLAMKKLEEQRQELERGKISIKKWQGLAVNIDTIKKNFFAKDTALFKTFVEQQVQAANISVNLLTPSKKQKDFYFDVAINIKGYTETYTNVVKFIKGLESKNITVESLRIVPDAQKRKLIEIVLRSYVIDE